jgi:hypothetical protein
MLGQDCSGLALTNSTRHSEHTASPHNNLLPQKLYVINQEIWAFQIGQNNNFLLPNLYYVIRRLDVFQMNRELWFCDDDDVVVVWR